MPVATATTGTVRPSFADSRAASSTSWQRSPSSKLGRAGRPVSIALSNASIIAPKIGTALPLTAAERCVGGSATSTGARSPRRAR